jgi:hypothetical protein
VGLGLGYRIISRDARAFGAGPGVSSGVYHWRAGARHFFSPKMAAYGDVGAGGATLNVGLMFKLN